ncbi:MAG: methyltransferase domain-containing protein [Polyangiaceae bacterium]|nr:methyltransferase domain-containing protein [Polyangiaceae bacterium]
MTELRYDCDRARLSSALAERFVELEPDDETRAFVRAAASGRHGRLLSWVHSTLGAFFSDFDVNGLLGTYPLFLLSRAEWATLLGPERRARLLDVGAGSGEITARLAPLADEVVTSETSRMMARRLRQRGFECRHADLADAPPADRFDLVTCLNVLDRSDRPRSLLRNLAAALAPRGQLVVATPLPYRPFVYAGGTTRDPTERLPIDADPWETAVTQLVERVLGPLGLEVVALCRAPYLSGGDPARELYVLDDAVVVCRRSDSAC